MACNKPGRGEGGRERTCLEGWCHSFAQIGGGCNSNTGTGGRERARERALKGKTFYL